MATADLFAFNASDRTGAAGAAWNGSGSDCSVHGPYRSARFKSRQQSGETGLFLEEIGHAIEPPADGASVVFTTRKPFDVLIEGLYSETSRGDRI